jgi:hypothetical protein
MLDQMTSKTDPRTSGYWGRSLFYEAIAPDVAEVLDERSQQLFWQKRWDGAYIVSYRVG